jgi:predicted glycosyltransferase
MMTDRHFSGLFPTDQNKTLDQVKEERRKLFYDLFIEEGPDLFVIELYPFGRRAFRFELLPLLKGIRNGSLNSCRVVCSVRDILVEKKDQATYEDKVVEILNRYFDALLVHADPNLVKLDETFSRIEDITIPVVYTGYVTPGTSQDDGDRLRHQLGISNDDLLIVASAGGGKVGIVLLQPVIEALNLINTRTQVRLHIFTGPYMPAEEFKQLTDHNHQNVHVSRFTSEFLSYLAAADLSVSMGGYNTCMNILATRVPALIWPYPGDREQGLRAERLAHIGAVSVIMEKDLQPARLADLIKRVLEQRSKNNVFVDLNGSLNTARWIAQGESP